MAFDDLVGQKVPSATFHTYQDDQFVDVSTDELFDNKKVVLFSLPGAFTPTCSMAHLPRYNELADEFKKLGVDDVVCVSVNDAFVMNAWAYDQGCDNVRMIPDGNGDFTRAMGRLVEKNAAGLGSRSWRYSMFVDNGTIVKIFDEPQNGSGLEVSDAETMIKYLNPDWQDKPSVSIITKEGCVHCDKAKKTLTQKGFDFEELMVGLDVSMTSVRAMTGTDTVPQIFIDGKHIGGNDDLQAYFAN